MGTIDQDALYKLIGEKIKISRQKLGISQDKLAEEMNLSRASIVNIEKGRQKATIHFLYKVAYVLEVKPTEILPESVKVFSSTQDWDNRIKNSLDNESDSNTSERVSNFVKKIISEKEEK
jgi:transcriptional regulator with XRE-family HTH domain